VIDGRGRVAELFGSRRRVAAVVLGVAVVIGLAWFLVWLITGPPAAFRYRAELPSCGRIAAGLGPVTGDPVACFDAALREGRGAELVVVQNTTEGDPIVTYYRALPGGGAELFTDSTEDSYGDGGWSHLACSDAREFGALGGCVEES
jgi:hypothetical protein